MFLPSRIRRFSRSLLVLAFAGFVSLHCGQVHAQVDTNAGDGGGVSGTQFNPEEVDMSAFEGIERGDSVGTASTQGFGLVGESTGGAAGGRATAGGGGGGGGFGGLGGLGGLFGGLGGAFGGGAAASQKPTIRVRLRSAINMPPRPAAEVQRSVARTLSAAPERSGVRGVNVTMDGRTAILSGTVASEKDRRMSELLIRLEPGVSRVDNRVLVGN